MIDVALTGFEMAECCYAALNFHGITNVDCPKFDTQGWCYRLDDRDV
jgi:hypothetical protein